MRLIPEHLADPLRWKRPRRIFVNSMSDLFHQKLSNEEIAAVLGVMAAAPQHTDERIPLLLDTPAAKRFVSVEPQLGPVDLTRYVSMGCACGSTNYMMHDVACPVYTGAIDWVIQGCESGPGARPFDPTWARSMRDQCRAAGVAFFYKQGPGESPGKPNKAPEIEGRTFKEFPR